jgi:hypothetical protein
VRFRCKPMLVGVFLVVALVAGCSSHGSDISFRSHGVAELVGDPDCLSANSLIAESWTNYSCHLSGEVAVLLQHEGPGAEEQGIVLLVPPKTRTTFLFDNDQTISTVSDKRGFIAIWAKTEVPIRSFSFPGKGGKVSCGLDSMDVNCVVGEDPPGPSDGLWNYYW